MNINDTDNDKRCAPGKVYKEGSCFSLDQLKTIALQINNKFPSSKINLNKSNSKKYMLRSITKVLKEKYDCDNQLCWLNLDIIQDINDEAINKYTFRPPGPDRGTKWLNTTNIDQVLEQYEKKHDDFISFGAVPRDFSSIDFLSMNLPENSLENLFNKGKFKIGVVFNHDMSGQSGSHWVAMFINLKEGNIYYFDSYGENAKKEILNFKDKIVEFLKSKKIRPNFNYNKIRHQFKGSECGVYSINFILRLLKGESFNEITQNITKDDDINLCRRVYFTS